MYYSEEPYNDINICSVPDYGNVNPNHGFDYEDDVELFNDLEFKPKYLSTIGDYLDLVFPSLSRSEYIGIFMKDKYRPRVEFFETKKEVEILSKGIFRSCDTYITLSTCIKVNGKLTKSSENMHRRYCLGFDFDKKDFEGQLDNIHDFTTHFNNTTGLFIHFVVDSGNGYHMYVGIEETADIARVTDITRRYAALSGADLANISQAQSLRLPCTINYKDPSKPMAVNIVAGYTNDDRFRRYSLDYLESHLRKLEKTAGIRRPSKKKNIRKKFKGMYPCISNIMSNGVPKGERNKCLGRLVSYFRDIAMVDPETALEAIIGWNKRCSNLCSEAERKTDKEITSDFNRYWENRKYNLLGCVSESNSISEILIKYCDKANCPKHKLNSNVDNDKFFILDKRYTTNKCLNSLKGYAYVILKVLLESTATYKVSELTDMTGFSEQTTSRTLKSLLDLELINKRLLEGISVYKARNFAAPKEKQYITLPNILFDMLIRRDISEQELVLYIAIRRNAYSGRKCTQVKLGKLLGLTERSISRITKQMVANGLIIVEARKTGEIIKKGEKTIEKTFNYYHFPLENEYAGSSSL